MTTSRHIVLFHAPNSRSGGARILLEELNADHELHVLNLRAGDTRKADYLAVNPMGKVPAIRHGDVLVTEPAAVSLDGVLRLLLRARSRRPGDEARPRPGLDLALTQQLSKGPWLLGEAFTAADVLWGAALTWVTGFKLVPELPEIKAYIDRFNARPAVVRARAKGAELAATQA